MRAWIILALFAQVTTTSSPPGGGASSGVAWPQHVAMVLQGIGAVSAIIGPLLLARFAYTKRKTKTETKKLEKEVLDGQVDIGAALHRIDDLSALKGKTDQIADLESENTELREARRDDQEHMQAIKQELKDAREELTEIRRELESYRRGTQPPDDLARKRREKGSGQGEPSNPT